MHPVTTTKDPEMNRFAFRTFSLSASLFLLAPGAAEAATLTVHVENGLTGDAMGSAFVMIGSEEGVPFALNTGMTDASGTIVFDDPGLLGPQTATAGFSGFGYTTLYESALDEVTLTLYPRAFDETMGGDHTRVEGEVNNVSNSNNDGFLDLSLVLNAISPETLVFNDYLPFLFGLEPVDLPVVGTVDLPENLFITRQTELLFLVFEKSPYRLGVPGNRPVSFVAVTARGAVGDLTADPDLNDFEIREIGVERDIIVTAPGVINLDINSDINTLPSGLTANLINVPAGSATRLVSGSTATSADGLEELFGYAVKEGIIDVESSYSLASFNPSGDLSDAQNVAMAEYADSSAARVFSVGILDRSNFSVPVSLNFESWFAAPDLSQIGTALQWEDPTVVGVSPTPTWTRSALGLRATDPNDGSVPPTVDWRIWAPASLGAIVLPELPLSAPGVPGGLTDPASTPESDEMSWSWTAVNSTGDSADLIGGNFLAEGTHWTQGWIPVAFETASGPQIPAILNGTEMAAYPSPSRDQVSLQFSQPLGTEGVLEIMGADGRRVAAWNLAAGSTRATWDGTGRDGVRAAGGVYWGRLLTEGKVLARTRIVRLP